MPWTSIPDDPIVRCIERTGYPPWYFYGEDDPDIFCESEDCDVYYGSETDSF